MTDNAQGTDGDKPAGGTLNPGFFVGHYRVVQLLGRDAAGEVYLTTGSEIQRQCVLRLLPPALSGSEDFCGRFAALGQQIGACQHPNVLRVHEVAEEFGLFYITTDYLPGPSGEPRTLADELAGQRLPERRVRELAHQILSALEHVHRNTGGTLVHGNLTFDNLLISPHEKIKIKDFGLAQLVGDAYTPPSDCASPERQRGTQPTAAGDIYSVGVILYRMLTGNDFVEGCPPPSACGRSPAWDAIVAQCVLPDPEARPQSAGELLQMLENMQERAGGKRKTVALLCVLLLLAATVGLAAVLGSRNARKRAATVRQQTEARRHQEQAADKLERARSLAAVSQTALKTLDYQTAGQAAREALLLDPDNAEAKDAQDKVQLALDPARVEALKSKATALWKSIEEMDGGQGFDPALNKTWSALSASDKALKTDRIQEAMEKYAHVIAECERLKALDIKRKNVAEARKPVEEARRAAWSANAADDAAELWGQADQAAKAAESEFDKGEFDKAAELWQEAKGKFALAQTWAKGAELVQSAQSTYEQKLAAADVEELKKRDPDAWTAIETAAAEAKQLAVQQKWRDAVSRWHEAGKLLAKAGLDSEQAARETEYQTAMKKGDEAMAARQWAAADLAFSQALLVKGYESDTVAARKLRQTRAAAADGSATAAVDRYSAPPKQKGNLVPNSDFEQGKDVPASWTRPDYLTIFWEEGGISGKYLRLDTDVYRKEWEEHMKNPVPGKKKTPTSGTRFNTVGGTVGVAVYSYGIPVEEDAWYRIEYDMKGPSGEQFIFLKGYWLVEAEDSQRFGKDIIFFKPDPAGPWFSLTEWGGVGQERHQPRAGDYMMSLKRRFVAKLPPGGKGKWHRYCGVLHLERKHHVEMVLLEIYAFWPPGDYLFDNVKMTRIPASEGENFKAWRIRHPYGAPLEK